MSDTLKKDKKMGKATLPEFQKISHDYFAQKRFCKTEINIREKTAYLQEIKYDDKKNEIPVGARMKYELILD